MPRSILALLAFLCMTWLSAQRIDTELLCAWRETPVHERSFTRPAAARIASRVELLTFADATAAAAAYARLSGNPRVAAVQYNWQVTMRLQPNDPAYPRQVNLARAGYETAWESATGGSTPDGRTIVTAILDAGFDVAHEDLVASLWVNTAEIPGDGLDNDGNGYIDDLTGWNFIENSAAYPVNTHGTQVAGLIGAAGNNGLGVSGTNWNSSLMLFAINTVADIVAAYQYIVDQREAYNRSGGSSGAFVVVTNASFGVEGGTCADFPVWGGMYDKLGAAGILTAASVANVSQDVDLTGDMPTDCPSDFLLGVTNVDQDDRLYPSAGYGKTSVDLGAPGEGSYTTRPGNTYGSFGSTSAAAPYVTGAVALLYATACDQLEDLVGDDPPAAARLIRESLLASVRVQPSLEFETSSGGVLDVARAQEELLRRCGSAGAVALRMTANPNPTAGALTVRVAAPGVGAGAVLDVYDTLGRRLITSRPGASGGQAALLPLDLSALPAGYYVIRLIDAGRKAVVPVVVN